MVAMLQTFWSTMSDTVTEIQHSLSYVLKPVSWGYRAIMRVRAGLYGRGLLSRWEPPVMTVSVGNIGWGGTGKTPVAGWLLGWAEQQGLETALLTRGYRAKTTSFPYVVHPGAMAEEAGDEPLMLAREHEKAHIVVDPNRTRSGKMAVKQFRPDLIILDDGFQHMAVDRHINLVLLRPEDLTRGWDTVIPAGSWREPKHALNRADAFLIKVGPKGFEQLRPHIEEKLAEFRKPVFSFQIMPIGIRRVLGGESARDFEQARYLLVTGVGNPAQVRATATAYLGYEPAKHMEYRDHHAYTKNDVMDMVATARKLKCDHILCTPKDAVKLGPMCTDDFWQFDLRLNFGPSTMEAGSPFDVWWGRRFDAFNLRREDRAEYESELKARWAAEENEPPKREGTDGKKDA